MIIAILLILCMALLTVLILLYRKAMKFTDIYNQTNRELRYAKNRLTEMANEKAEMLIAFERRLNLAYSECNELRKANEKLKMKNVELSMAAQKEASKKNNTEETTKDENNA